MAPPPSISLIASRSEEEQISEDERLAGLYDRLRERLLDLTNRNPMLNTAITPNRRSRRLLQIVNVPLEGVHQALAGPEPKMLDILPLAEPGNIPTDEQSEAFVSALDHARLTDPDYLEAIAKAEMEDGGSDADLAVAEDALRLKIRVDLGLPERQARHDVDRAGHAMGLGINPDPNLSLRDATPASASPPLQTLRYAQDLSDMLDRMADSARLAAQETGMSTLFLAFGFLERPNPEVAGKSFRAPLLLLPVRLVTRRVDGREIIAIAATGGAEVNLSLRRLLERDIRRVLPDFETAPAEDEDGAAASIGAYFDAVARAIDGLAGWQIRPWLVLGTLAFGRYQIYHDLAPEAWPQPPFGHPLVRAILAGTDRLAEASEFAVEADYDIDASDIQREVPHLIADADASQHSVLVDVARQKNLVIEGPPGTGKSQTIANIIAHAIGQGKKVLFLSEKQAALDVVRRRLHQAGLGPFCLELHSDAATPKAMIEALRTRADLGWGRPRTTPKPVDPALIDARQTIGRYLQALHEQQDDGETPFRLMWRALRGMRGHEAMHDALRHLSPGGDWLTDAHDLRRLQDAIEVYALAAAEFEARHGSLGISPWSRTGLNDIPTYDLLRLRARLTLWREPMLEAASLVRQGRDFGLETLADLDRLCAIEERLGAVGGVAYLEAVTQADNPDLSEILTLLARIAAADERMAVTPDLENSPRTATARAAELMASRFGAALGGSVPVDLDRAIRMRVEDARELIAAIEGLMPALEVLGLERDRPGEEFGAIALICRALASMTPARRSQLLGYREIEAESVDAALKSYSDLAGALDDWRRYFPGLDPAHMPRAADIRAAVSWIGRTGLARAFSGVGAEAKAARTLIETLFGGAGRPDPDLLVQLADFVDYCETFQNDPSFRKQFGTAWRGVATPLASIQASIKVRAAFRQALSQALGSADIVDRLFDLGDDGIASFARLAAPAERFLALPAEAKARLNGFSLGSAIPTLEAEIRAAGALADLAGDTDLMTMERPLGLIAEYHAARETSAVLRRELAWFDRAQAVKELVGDGDARDALAALRWIGEVRASPLPDAAKLSLIGQRAEEMRARMGRIAVTARSSIARLKEVAAETEAEFGWLNLDAGEPAGLLAQIDALIAEHGQLADFLVLRRLKLDLAAEGLGTFLDTVERFGAPMKALPDLFATMVAGARAENLRRMTPLAQSTGMEMEVRRRIFAERDRQRFANDRMDIRAKLTELPELRPIPGNNVGPKSAWTEMALLNSEFPKNGRYLPIRTLLARAGRSIQALAPCLMASPLSLAKFATPGKLAFDLVVIDEASQMRPEDAIGALLRTKQVVVAGDSRQLPPTDFFRRSEPETAGVEDEVDAESILEVCTRSLSAIRRLKWHYRSRCESLIAFSNREFYRDTLITFPNSRPDAFSIDLVRVNGSYRNRRNPDEAAAIAEEAVQFMRQSAMSGAMPTLGIITLNIEQRDLIREELRRISVGDEFVASYMAEVAARGEPLFVKNLENVQGDERDYILISLVRGRSSDTGAVAQTFGPIGGRHGARRLNVLVTRARVGIGLFASFGSDDIRTSETSPPGVHALKRYLQYVEERGRQPIASETEDPDSDFEEEVADRLRAAGFEVAYQIGVSQYRIDLGVRDPDRPGSFLAGIECDGARYHSSKSARDRDRLREEVLRGLGWDLIRVWSTDWFADPEEETRRLVRRLDLMRVVPDRAGVEYRFGSVSERLVRDPVRVEPEAARAAEASPAVEAKQLTLDLENALQQPVIASDSAIESGIAQYAVTAALVDDTAAQAPTPGPGEPDKASETIGEIISPVPDLSEIAGLEEAAHPYLAEQDETRAVPTPVVWDPEQVKEALVAFRDGEIYPVLPEADRQRSILRPSLIEIFVHERIRDARDWETKVPRYLRLGTNAAELRFLERICGIVAGSGS